VFGVVKALFIGLFILFVFSIGIARDTCVLPNGKSVYVWTGNNTFLGLGESPHPECDRETLLEVVVP
jgi:hypothetical protein